MKNSENVERDDPELQLDIVKQLDIQKVATSDERGGKLVIVEDQEEDFFGPADFAKKSTMHGKSSVASNYTFI